MLIIADANELFAALISRKKTLDLFINRKLTIASPEFVLKELKEHSEEISEKSGLSKEDFETFLFLIKSKIKFFKTEEFSEFLKEAEVISPDPDDIEYIALALKLNCPIWSEDKLLKRQNKVNVFSTLELLEMFEL